MRKKKVSFNSGLAELIIAILVFAFTAAICVRIFVGAYSLSNNSRELNTAVAAAQSGADCYKYSGGDLSAVADIMGGNVQDNRWTTYLDESGAVTSGSDYSYVLTISETSREGSLKKAELNVSDVDGKVIFALYPSALEVPA